MEGGGAGPGPAAVGASSAGKPMILITNDDGIDAPALRALVTVLVVTGLLGRYQNDLENLTLTAQPFKTIKYFVLAMVQYLQCSIGYIFTKGGFLSLLVSAVAAAAGIVLLTFDGPHEKHIEEISQYVQFGLWWIALGVASSIGLARISGSSAMDEFDVSPGEKSGVVSRKFTQIKCWLLSHCQYVNFVTVLILASVPNPLFDLAFILCGQFGIPFWVFFLANLVEKAIIKTHVQTVFIISVCNNQLLNWIENELIPRLSSIPLVASVLPDLVCKLNALREKYMTAPPPTPSSKEKKWDLSFASIWNSVVWLMLVNFFIKIVTATA